MQSVCFLRVHRCLLANQNRDRDIIHAARVVRRVNQRLAQQFRRSLRRDDFRDLRVTQSVHDAIGNQKQRVAARQKP